MTIAPEGQDRVEIRSLRVIHYGPRQVDDPDHSTSINVLIDGKRPVPRQTALGSNLIGKVLSLENDSELDELILKLLMERARDEDITGDLYKLMRDLIVMMRRNRA